MNKYVIVFNEDGTIKRKSTNPLFSDSQNQTAFDIRAPFTYLTAFSNFLLANGLSPEAFMMEYAGTIEEDGVELNQWFFTIEGVLSHKLKTQTGYGQ